MRIEVAPLSQTLPVSVCIPVRNEALNLPACLAALADFPEVVVVDSKSTDATVEIARTAGATVLQFEWNGEFPKKRNWVLRNHLFSQPWVFFLDADERVTPAFVAELREILPKTDRSGFWVEFTNWFMGQPLHHGDVFRKLCLFKIGSGEYERMPEMLWSRLDMEVHEHPVLKGPVGAIRTRLEHHDQRDLSHYLAKHNEYSSWEAARFLWLEEAGEQAWQELTGRQRFKYRNLDQWWFALFYWFAATILKGGIRDGKAGLRLAALKRRYFAEIRLKIIENRARARSAAA